MGVVVIEEVDRRAHAELLGHDLLERLAALGEDRLAHAVVEALHHRQVAPQAAQVRARLEEELLDQAALELEPALELDVVVDEVAVDGRDRDAIDLFRPHPGQLHDLGDGLARYAEDHLLAHQALLVDGGDQPAVDENGGAAVHVVGNAQNDHCAWSPWLLVEWSFAWPFGPGALAYQIWIEAKSLPSFRNSFLSSRSSGCSKPPRRMISPSSRDG